MKNFITIIVSLLLLWNNPLIAQLTDPVWVYTGEAKRYIAKGEISLALELLNNVINEYPDSADAHYLLATIYEKEAGDPGSFGGSAVYLLAINEYNKTIQYAENLAIPAYELDAYFSLLQIYERLIDDDKYAETEILINRLTERATTKLEKGRIYFRLADYYSSRNQDFLALENYNLAYENGYRQKISLFKISLLYRKMRNYVEEKSKLLLADRYDFDYEETINFDVKKAIYNRLIELQNVEIPQKFY